MSIKKYIFQLTLIPLILLLATCSKKAEKDPVLVEAFEVHKKSLSLAKDVKKILSDISASDSISTNFEQRVNSWEEMLVEVPGFEHEHDHDHDHDHEHHHHDHGTELNLTPQQIFDIQMELQDSITAIKEEVMMYKESIGK